MGYHYTVPNDCSCRTYFYCFPLALANIYMPMASRAILSNFFEEQRPQNHHTTYPILPFGIVARTFSDNLPRNICIYDLYKIPRFGGPVFSSVLSRKTNFSSLNSVSRIWEGRTWRFHCNLYTAISRKVVAKNVHATIPKGNMGYVQYTVPDIVSCRTYFVAFL